MFYLNEADEIFVANFGVSFEPDTEPAKEHYMNMYGHLECTHYV